MNLLPFATVLTVSLVLPALGMAQSFNPLWAVPSNTIHNTGDAVPVLMPAANASPRANFFAGVSGYGPQLKAVVAPAHAAVASSLPVSN